MIPHRESLSGAGRSSGIPTLAVGFLAVLAVFWLYLPWIVEPHIRYDDFNFLTKSRTWVDTRANLLLPMNEHVMPLARLDAAILMQLVPRPSAIPRAAEAHGVAAVALGMWLVFLFVRRELQHPFYGLIAMILFGVTTSYYECVTWYSASFFTLALDMTLAGLLAAQAYARGRRSADLAMCAVACALAPAFHGTALLAGAWCGVYILSSRAEAPRYGIGGAATPLLGTAAFVVFSLAAASGTVMHAAHYRGKTIVAAFDPVEAVRNTLRTLADNQIPGLFGYWNKSAVLPWPAVLLVAAALAALAVFWWRTAPRRQLLLLGLALILASDLIVYGARADWSYDRTVHNWTRYHLFPHLGIVLFIAGGLPRFERRWPTLVPGRLSLGQTTVLVGLTAVLLACHRPRSVGSHFVVPPEQMAVLQRVERVDERCRQMHIDAPTARAALGFLQFPLGYAGDNAWDLLRGSPSPAPVTVGRARELLARIP